MKREFTSGSFVFNPEEIYFKKEAPVNILAGGIVEEFFIILGISLLARIIFQKSRRLSTAVALSAVGLGLKLIAQDNTNEQIPDALTFPPAEARHW